MNCVKFAVSLLMLSAPVWSASVSGYIGTFTSHGSATNGSVGIYSFHWSSARGCLVQLAEGSVLPPGSSGRPSAAELALSADGRFIYASTRAQSNSNAAFHLDREGNPTVIGSIASGGTTPRFIIIDPASGALTPKAGEAEITAPVDIVFLRNIQL